MKIKHLLVGIVVAIAFTATVQAQTVSFGTSPQGGSNNALCTALGKVVNEKTGLKIRIVPMAGAEQYGPMIDAGRMDVAVASSTDVKFAHDGIVTFKGRP